MFVKVNARRTTHDKGLQPIEICHLNDSGGLKIYLFRRLTSTSFRWVCHLLLMKSLEQEDGRCTLHKHTKIWIQYIAVKNFKIVTFQCPTDLNFHGQCENDGFVSYEHMIKQCNNFCKYTNINVMKKKSEKITYQQ